MGAEKFFFGALGQGLEIALSTFAAAVRYGQAAVSVLAFWIRECCELSWPLALFSLYLYVTFLFMIGGWAVGLLYSNPKPPEPQEFEDNNGEYNILRGVYGRGVNQRGRKRWNSDEDCDADDEDSDRCDEDKPRRVKRLVRRRFIGRKDFSSSSSSSCHEFYPRSDWLTPWGYRPEPPTFSRRSNPRGY